MVQQISKRLMALSIRLKLLIGFGTLILLVVLEIGVSAVVANQEQTARNRVEDVQNEVVQAQSLRIYMLLARQAEFQSFADLFLIGYEASYRSYSDVLVYVQQAQEIMVDLKANEGLLTAATTDAEGEALPALLAIDQEIEDYETMVIDLVTVKTVERGTLEAGMAGDFMSNLYAIQEHMDVTPIVEMSTAYIETFSTDFTVTMQIPAELNRLAVEVQDSEMDGDTKTEITDQIDAARSDFVALAAHDVGLVLQINTMTDLLVNLNDQIDRYVQGKLVEQETAEADFNEARRTGQNLIIAVRVTLVAAALLFAFVITRLITIPLVTLDRTAQSFAKGHYDERATVESNDEIGKLAGTLNSMALAVNQRENALRETAENLRIASEQAREAERVKSEFLATMSHELRTPLNAIIGFADILAYGMVGELTDPQREKLGRLQTNAKRLLTLINDVLDLSRIEAGRAHIKPQPFSPMTLANRVRNQVAVLAEQKELSFDMVVDPALPQVLEGDEARIEQIIVNLVANAVKFTSQGGIELHLSCDQANSKWHIIVKDTGIGIAPHARHLIFEAFRQEDGSSTRKHQGSGLGLAIVEKLVRLMDGHIQVDSVLGEGSTFTVTLPLIVSDLVKANSSLQKEAGDAGR